MMQLTTLQLAEAVASAVIAATRPDGNEPYGNAPARAVLDTLHKYDVWFCRVTENDRGVTVETPCEQLKLFEEAP